MRAPVHLRAHLLADFFLPKILSMRIYAHEVFTENVRYSFRFDLDYQNAVVQMIELFVLAHLDP
jgi:hypothetical protein